MAEETAGVADASSDYDLRTQQLLQRVRKYSLRKALLLKNRIVSKDGKVAVITNREKWIRLRRLAQGLRRAKAALCVLRLKRTHSR
tara:strand:- start:435 stop:692 length:258 start_codon:yes stop_codon:yes gene_type:complete